ncbi:MAG: hypothetical protein ACRDSR_00470 [Pseudonocardiaceae bacterium]
MRVYLERKLEQGRRNTASIGSLYRIARVLMSTSASYWAVRGDNAPPITARHWCCRSAMRSTLSSVLIRQGRFRDAEQVATTAAAQIQPAGNSTTVQLSVYGGLLLRGATTAARGDRPGVATELLVAAGTDRATS